MISLKLILEQILFEDKYSENQKQFVGEGPKKITQQQFDNFWNFAKDQIKYYKYIGPLLSLAVNSPDKNRFFDYKDYENYFEKQGGFLTLYINNFAAIKRENPKYTELRNFGTLDKFKQEVVKFKQTDTSKGSSLTSLDLVKLKNVGIGYLGSVDGYQVVKIPSSKKNSTETWKTYREIICKGTTAFCTASTMSFFNQYLSTDNLYLFINSSDKDAPYQFHFKSDSFMNRHDVNII